MTRPTRCDYCHDVGMVELAGYTNDGYSRGSAPCKWCAEGERIRNRLEEEHQHPLTDYSIHSLAATPQPGYHAVTKEEALADWNNHTHEWVDDGPPQARPWNGDSIQYRTCRHCTKLDIVTVKIEAHHSSHRD